LKLLEDKGKGKKEMNLDCGKVTREVRKNDLHEMTINASYKNKEDIIQEICNYINNALTFNLIRSPLFIQMLKAVGDYEKGLRSPSYHEVRVSSLKKSRG